MLQLPLNPASRPLAAEVLGDIARARDLLTETWASVALRTNELDAASELLILLDPYRQVFDFNGAFVSGCGALTTATIRFARRDRDAASGDIELAAGGSIEPLGAPLLAERAPDESNRGIVRRGRLLYSCTPVQSHDARRSRLIEGERCSG